jgi:hypothetical protein
MLFIELIKEHPCCQTPEIAAKVSEPCPENPGKTVKKKNSIRVYEEQDNVRKHAQ